MCDTCRATPKRFRAAAGYDRRLVPKTECLTCKKPIGAAKFVDIPVSLGVGQPAGRAEAVTGPPGPVGAEVQRRKIRSIGHG